MRSIATAIPAAVVLAASTASSQGQPSLPVEDLPVAVEVANPAMPTRPIRFQLVGFTASTYTGDLGGPFGAAKKCQLEFPDSRICLAREVQLTTTVPDSLVGDAWATEEARPGEPIVVGLSCQQWTFGSGSNRGGRVLADGSFTSTQTLQLCSQMKSIACCALVP